MSTAPLQPSVPQRARIRVAIVLAVWLAAVLILGANGLFRPPRGTPPLALLIGCAGPIIASVLAYRISPAFRAWVLGIEPRVLVSLQAWRWAGLSFVSLYVYGILPGFFAWPAGLGDMAIGATAPWMLWRLTEAPAFVSSRAFARWNLLGILDLVVALSLGAIGGMFLADQPVTTAPMGSLPLVLIPVFLVPIFIMMHFALLLHAKRAA
jgi:hypothetical protein